MRNEEMFKTRFKAFSDEFFHKLYQKPYPDDLEEQGIAYLFEETRIQFLTFNSCWEIDHFHQKNAGIHPGSVANAIRCAEQQVFAATSEGRLKEDDEVLRIAVWHHALAHPETIRNTDFVDHLKNCNVRLALHGDVHELNCERIGSFQNKQLNVVGVGTFGSSHEGLPEATSRHYNVLEVYRDKTSGRRSIVRVHTRQQRKIDGAWEGWYGWQDPSGSGRQAFFDINLESR